MIKYALTCADGHTFESWFQSGQAFDTLHKAGHVACMVCGSADVAKTIMAPAVTKTKVRARAVNTPDIPAESPLAKLRDKIESEADYVGPHFAKEARAMHDGDTPERPIYGEAKPAEAMKLISDGIPVMPLPFIPRKRTN